MVHICANAQQGIKHRHQTERSTRSLASSYAKLNFIAKIHTADVNVMSQKLY